MADIRGITLDDGDKPEEVSLQETFDAINNNVVDPIIGDDPNIGDDPMTPNDGTLNFEEMAKSPFGDLELTKYLYESGLQNIFSDYQQNIERLSQQEKQALQDSYYIKEMSKKYLGEYASNIGLGDVSGNLLDIYSKYQENIGDIKGSYDELELNLSKEYQTERIESFNNIMMTQYNIEAAKLDKTSQDILFNVQTGNTGDMTPFEYLETQKDTMREEDYQAIYGTLYTQQMQEITTNIQNGFYGYTTDAEGNRVRETDVNNYLAKYKETFSASDFSQLEGIVGQVQSQNTVADIQNNIATGNYEGTSLEYLESQKDMMDAGTYRELYTQVYAQEITQIENNLASGYYGYKEVDGERVRITDPQEYLDQYKDDLSPKHYQELSDQLQLIREETIASEELGEVIDYGDPTSEGYQPNFDPSYYYSGDANITSESNVYEFLGQQHFQVIDNVDNDESLPSYTDSETLFEYYEQSNPGDIPNAGEIMNYRGTYFAFDNGNWHRLVSGQGSKETQLFAEQNEASWTIDGNKESANGYKDNGNKSDTLTIGSVTYTENNDDIAKFSSKDDASFDQGLVDKFNEVHGGGTSSWGIKYQSVVFYEGRFWVFNENGRFTPMAKNT